MAQSIGPGLRRQWRLFSRLPAGKWLFSRVLGLLVPYTGSLGATVQTLEPGHCIVTLRDRRRLRNHLQSIHAIALCNLGEMSSGLALMNSLPDKTRGILAGLSIEYRKKGRGRLSAECYCEIPDDSDRELQEVESVIRDQQGDLIATVKAHWLIGPEKEIPNGAGN